MVYKRLLLILLLVITSTSYSQFDWFSNKGGVKYYAYTPVNIGAVASYDQIIFTGGSTRITSDEISGTKIAFQRWMRWWTDTDPIDSVNGYAKLLTGITEDIPYYYSQSGRYITATDTIYGYAETDTVYSIIYPPYSTSVDAIEDGIAIAWANGSDAELGYEISYAKYESSVWTVHDTTAPDVTSINITGLEVSNTYKARVRSIGTYSNSTYSNISYAFISVNCTTPDTISVLSAVGSPATITLTWTDVTADSVYIYKGTSTNPSSYLIAVDDGVQTYIDSAVTQGAIYYYRLRAYENVCGLQGVYSATVFDTVKITDTTPPSAPTLVDAVNISVDTAPPDTIGTLSAFTNVTGATRSAYYTAFSIVSVVDSCHAYCAGDSFRVGIYGVKDVIHRKVYNGDTVYVGLTASPLYSSTLSRTVTVSNTNSRTYTVTTIPDPTVSNWYVDRDSPGGLNGTTFNGQSWSTAWREFNSTDYWGANPEGIQWDLIGAGDTIFVSGGTDSTAYFSTSEGAYGINTRWTGNSNWSGGAQVVMCPAWHPNHNGTVHITDYGTSSPLLWIRNVSNFKFTGFTITDNRTSGSSLVQIGSDDAGLTDSLIVFENNHVIGRGLTEGVYLNGTKTTVRNNIIENLQNSLPNSQDLLTISGGQGGHTIDGNTLIYRNDNDTTDAHRDMFQMSNTGYNFTSAERQQITVSNNFFIDTNPGGGGWNNMLYNYGWTGTANARYLIYNNIFVNNKNETSVGALAIGRYYEGAYANHNSIYVLNNTFINNGTTGGMFTSWCLDTLVMKNNIWIKDNNAANFINPENSPSLWASVYKDIDYNHYAELGGIDAVGNVFGANIGTGVGNAMSWDEWQTGLIDLNSTISNSTAVTFTNKYGETREDYYTTTGRDIGVDLLSEFPFLQFDALGNERTGDWDMGALEFGGVAVADTVPSAFVFTDITNAPLSQLHISNAITLAGFDSAWCYAGGASFTVYQFGAVQPYTYRTAPIKVYANDIVRVRLTSSASNSTAVNVTLTVGGVEDTYTVTTLAPSAPDKLFRRAIYLTQSVGTHIYDHSQVENGGGVTNVPTELANYNTREGYTAEYTCTINRDPIYPSDYPPTGNQIWHWADAFEDNGTHTFKEDYLDTDTYDIIMIKHCGDSQTGIWAYWFDGASDTLTYPYTQSTYNYQWYARKILRVMEAHPDKFFVWWDLWPGHEGMGSASEMQRTADFCLWMTDTLAAGLDSYGAFPPNVKIFDVWNLVDSSNWLPYSYRDHVDDYHPNSAAADVVAPQLVQQMFDAAILYESTYNGGMNRVYWNRIAPFLKSDETNFWKGLQR